MRDDSFLQQESDTKDAAAARWRGRAATTAGALISIALLAAVVIWSYRLGVRDANDVPVIRAQTDATKIKPDEPGGLEVAHQNREVYNVISGGSSDDDIALAPSAETLAPEDAPIGAAPAPAPRPSADPAPEQPAASAPLAPAPAEPTVAEPAPVTETAETEPAQADIATPEEPAAEDAEPTAAPARAPVAARRPQRSAAAPAAAEQQAEPRAAALASRIQIQLGAFNTEAIAAEQWSALKNRNGDLLSGRGRVVTPVESGGRRLFRLRAGPFGSVNEASSLCRALKSRGEDCIVARAK